MSMNLGINNAHSNSMNILPSMNQGNLDDIHNMYYPTYGAMNGQTISGVNTPTRQESGAKILTPSGGLIHLDLNGENSNHE